MYAIYGTIYHQYTLNVGIYTTHGSVMGFMNQSRFLSGMIWDDSDALGVVRGDFFILVRKSPFEPWLIHFLDELANPSC